MQNSYQSPKQTERHIYGKCLNPDLSIPHPPFDHQRFYKSLKDVSSEKF